MPSVAELLERESETVDLEHDHFERLLRRRYRKERNRRVSAAVLAIVVTVLSIMGLMRAFRNVERPATEPTPTPRGIFSDVGGWIVYGPLSGKCEPWPCANTKGIRAMDPTRREGQIQLTTDREIPLAWSSDGSELLMLRTIRNHQPDRPRFENNLFVLNADGTETRLTESDSWVSGGSFSPDGTKVIYSGKGGTGRSAIYVVDASGGTPRVLLPAGPRRFPDEVTSFRRTAFPTFSPDGSQIAFVDGWGGAGTIFMVMNADGSDPRVLLHDETFQGAGHIYSLVWSPDGTRLAFDSDFAYGIYTFGADGSGLTLVIPGGRNPHWSPDGSHIAYDNVDVPFPPGPYLEIADADGKNPQVFGNARSGPWNPLVQPEPEVAEAPAASEGLTFTSTLLLSALLPALIAGVVLIRRRKVHRS
jgi:dipeptidyl aminopeptidase/acylaminoacyl peptidase